MFNVLVVIVVLVLVQDTYVFDTAQTYCSVRTGDSSSGYWDTAFGSEKFDAICKTSTCLNAADYKADMPFCAEEVTYSTNICTGAGIDKGGNISIIAILLSSWFIVLTLARVY